ncbi:MAG TPA: VOC family protein [Chitinophagaceae bacterium]|nr:VOC family protein [Chitinophagaceae bacterium]
MKLKLILPSYVLFALAALTMIAYAFTFKPKFLKTEKLKPVNMSEPIVFSTYLLFDGTCKEAMEFYKSCFGGELSMTSVGESPMKVIFPESMHKRVVNAKLVSGNVNISASDWLRPSETPVQGNTVCLYLSGGTYSEIKSLFDKLSHDATITDPLKEEAFGVYGALNDKFGLRWMFHTAKKD